MNQERTSVRGVSSRKRQHGRLVTDDRTGHLSTPPGIETNRRLHDAIDWEGESRPASPDYRPARLNVAGSNTVVN